MGNFVCPLPKSGGHFLSPIVPLTHANFDPLLKARLWKHESQFSHIHMLQAYEIQVPGDLHNLDLINFIVFNKAMLRQG